ncbi:hypothetical protein [Myroides odoratimimus]|uniref:hypothetical protein n=1 Tax=Myroides odoratimimus TaxID=76832 RepID=UPI002576E41A|nr:hypothetical protein [Myroides odoratimimus]MDM1328109.1 hypothetical protein [Myroides odoratimimus]
MKKLILLTIVTIFLTSCGGMLRGVTGSTKGALIKQVAVETGCHEEKIKIIEMSRNAGSGTFALDVCGERKIYKQIGSVFMSNEEANKLNEKLKK